MTKLRKAIRNNRSTQGLGSSPRVMGFAAKVYRAVLSIPFGQVRSYKWVAKKCGSPGASRAVGTVLARNPYPLIIPCHRVVKSDRQIGGYNLGTARKKFLLSLEKELAVCIFCKR
jgi:O-6-methylguanine DNA methyltransferase